MLGEKIRNLRKERKISQEELAERLNVSRQSISLWENGQTQPTVEKLMALAEIFGVTVDDILKSDSEEEKIVNDKKKDSEGRKSKSLILWFLVLLTIIAGGIITFSVHKKDKITPVIESREQIKENINLKSREQLKEEFDSGKYDFYYRIDSGKYKGTVHHRSCHLLTDSVKIHKNAFPTVDMAYKKGYKRCPECNCIKK